jgi:aspartate racemase
MTRILGIVGGTGPESTVDYYRSIIASWQRRRPDGSYPRLIIDSLEAGRIFRLLAEGDLSGLAGEVIPALERLAAAGAGCALLASNATHLAFDEIAAASPDPAPPYRRLGVLGTRYVMEASMYPDRFEARGIAIVVPTSSERDDIHAIYFDELVRGVFLDGTRERLVNIVASMRHRDGIDGLLLGGTELSLILTETVSADVPVLDTAKTHADAAVDWLLESPEIAS